MVAVVLQRFKPRTDTSKKPIVQSRVDTSATEYSVGAPGKLGATSQSDVEALRARMEAMEIEYAAMKREYAQRIETMEATEAEHAEEISGIREKVGRQSFLEFVQLRVVTSRYLSVLLSRANILNLLALYK